MDEAGVHLRRTEENAGAVAALVAAAGGPVGLDGVLGDLDRRARAARVPGSAAAFGFRWDLADEVTQGWYPQGITTSADQGSLPEDRPVVVTSWYSRGSWGSRLTFTDVSDPSRIRYRHVLLVDPAFEDGRSVVRPVKAHAGGIVWHGDYVHVAATARGLWSFRLDDLVRAPAGMRVRGYEYLLPARFRYEAVTAEGVVPFRYSFLSLDRAGSQLVAGEYGRGAQSMRLLRLPLDPVTSLPRHDTMVTRPLELAAGGVPGMQGAVVVDGTWFVTTSAGRLRRGSLWVGRPGALRRYGGVLPIGPEDITAWPSRGLLWSLSEHPGLRFVFAMPLSSFQG